MANVDTSMNAVEYVKWALSDHNPDRIGKRKWKVGDISLDMQQVVRDCWLAAGWLGDACPYWATRKTFIVREDAPKVLSEEEVLETVTETRARLMLSRIIKVCEEYQRRREHGIT